MGVSYELVTREGCHLCDEMAAVLDEVLPGYGLAWSPRNVDAEPELAARFGIMSIPALYIFKGGRVVDQVIGLQPRSVIAKGLGPRGRRRACEQGEIGHFVTFLDTRSRNRARSIESGSGDLIARRAATAPTTAKMQTTSIASIHADQVSVPVPKP